MARTSLVGSEQVGSSTVVRANLNTSLAGSAVIAKILVNSGITITSTGADSGTGDVTLGLGDITPTRTLVGNGTSSALFSVNQTSTGPGTVSNSASSGAITGVGTRFTDTFKVGDSIAIGAETKAISAISSDTSMTTAVFTSAHSGSAYTVVTSGLSFEIYGNKNFKSYGTGSMLNLNVGDGSDSPVITLWSSSSKSTTETISFQTTAASIEGDQTLGVLRFLQTGSKNFGFQGGSVVLASGSSTSTINTGLSGSVGGVLQMISGTTAGSRVAISEFSNDTNYPALTFLKSRGSLLTYTKPVADDPLGSIEFYGVNNSGGAVQGALIQACVDGTISSSNIPVRLEFYTSNVLTGMSLAMTISGGRQVTMTNGLTVSAGSVTVTTGSITATAGGITATAGDVKAGGDLIAGTNGTGGTTVYGRYHVVNPAGVFTIRDLNGTVVDMFKMQADGQPADNIVGYIGPTSPTNQIFAWEVASGKMTVFNTFSLASGTTSDPPLMFSSGSNLTTPAAGAMEYDGVVFYATPAASARMVVDTTQFIQLSSAYTLTSQTAAQKLFNSTTNGAVTLAVGTYDFECMFSLSSMSTATSGSFGFALGGTATKTQAWRAEAIKTGTAVTTPQAPQITYNTTSNTALTSATTSQDLGYAYIRGSIRVTIAGTVIPQVSLGVAAAAVVGVNSFFRIWPKGSSTVTNVGRWS